MTVAGQPGPPKYVRVAARVRRQIAEGTLLPGEPVPSGAALSRVTGFSTLTCRKALRVLIADGALVPGPSRNARPRVAAPGATPAERGLAEAARALSGALAARRRAAGLTQPVLAALVEVSVTTVGHAETGRLWQSRRFWARADDALRAGGELLRLHDAYRGAAAPPFPPAPSARQETAGLRPMAAGAGQSARPPGWSLPPCNGPRAPVPSYVMIGWPDGTVTIVRPRLPD